MTGQTTPARRATIAMGLVLMLAGCPGGQSGDDAALSIRGSDPGGTGAGAGPAISSDGIVSYDGYQAARAREGETVSALAARLGLSGAELGAYNGLAGTHVLRSGDELVLPPRPGGYEVASAAPAASSLPPRQAAAPAIEAQPLGAELGSAGGPGLGTDTGTGLVTGGTEPTTPGLSAEGALGTAGPGAPSESPLPNESGWSPELALQAIERSSGETAPTQTPGEATEIAAPPSAAAPLPDDPRNAPDLPSPGLSQYQTSRPSETAFDAAGNPVSPGAGAPAVALAPAPAPVPERARLARPVDGPVALGFREGAGGAKNEGVDFAAPAGAPVVAAEDGTVALVSEALGGLGTILLIRHDGDLLTVYGRISGVTVQKGDRVVRGQQIGVVAAPDGPVEPRMHFEVREGATSVDPMAYI